MLHAVRSRSLVLTLCGLAMAVGACRISPLMRGGELEPPKGERVLVDVWVRPVDRRQPPPDVVGAMGDQGVATLVLDPAPAVSTDDARAELASRTQGFDTPASDALVKPVDIALDARRLESIYAARGYFHARTRGWRVRELSGRRGRAEFDIEEGKQPSVTEVRFVLEGRSVLAGDEVAREASAPDREPDDVQANQRLARLERELPSLVPLERGDPWTEEAYQTGLDAIGRAFRGAGFLYARVSGDNWISKDTDHALVVYTIDHGPLVRAAGPPRVLNNHMVDTDRALKRADITKGDILDGPRLRDAERRLYELGVLLSVQLRPILGAAPTPPPSQTVPTGPDAPPPAEPPPAPPEPSEPDEEALVRLARPAIVGLDLELQEATPWDFSVSLAATVNSTEMRFGLPLTFMHRNVASELFLFQASAKPAISFSDFLGDTGFSDPQFAIESGVSFDVPSFFEEYLKLTLGVNYVRDPTQGSDRQEVGGAVAFSRRIVGPLSARLGWSFNYLDYLFRVIVTTDEALTSAALRMRNIDFAAWLDASLVLDLRDNAIDTRNGFYGVLGARLAGPWSGSRSEFGQLQLELRGFFTPSFLPFVTLAARAVGGIVFFPSTQGTPLAARFLSGGQNSHRAFDTNRMGDYVCKNADIESGLFVNASCPEDTGASDRNFVGGNYLFEVNGEVRFHFDGFGVVAFLDAGNLWSRAADVDFGDLVVALGLGLRIDTPVGPIRVDASRRIDIREGELKFLATLGQAF